ncbi:MAG: uroporphyrinogen decarboxylase [Pseudomonadota bacterium]
MEPAHRFLRACYRLPVDQTPVWFMRQAGRYLPQYRALRKQANFGEMLKNPDLACEATMQPIRELDPDAAIIFSDILVPLQAMGLHLDYAEDGPVLQPVRSPDDIGRLQPCDPDDKMPFLAKSISMVKRALAGKVPLIGFAGAPFTLASYAVEGGGSKSYTQLKRLLFGDPAAAHLLLDKLDRAVIDTLGAQIAAGVQAVQLFDTWASILSPRDFEEFALRHVRTVISAVRSEHGGAAARAVPIIYYVNGVAPYLSSLESSGADVVGLDYRVSIAEARARLGPGIAVQGNLDPAALFLPAGELAARTIETVLQAGARPGYIFNVGHGLLPETDPDSVRAVITAVRQVATSG